MEFIKYVVASVILLSGCNSVLEHQIDEKFKGIVMHKGMIITIRNPDFTLLIKADNDLLRHYTWKGKTRSIALMPRLKKWYGAYGAYFPGTDNHWKKHEKLLG